ncbi:UvrD-helicase domain-containing protein [Mycolicibacterium sp. OfavD-34-C]|uniref:UvrD-helicase domain-containing protein n=1 Tax=Mycolicibacterium sp. OfavD-34-C TaxID=2917746 RepID=UPI001EF640F0|nr:UvrD-helicase domain-containing protein [Mycolicibacterium sp. OfavD-34-C]MCG7578807.1 AAA family ATPase [Mycolicibacterium sp. OfavD-34-C]
MKTTVLMHDLFENSYNELDGSVKGRVLSFMVKLQQDPDATGLDFKRPKGAGSKHVRTARVNDNYRAVLVNAGADDDNSTLWLVAVKKHDDAYKFAETLTLQVNEKTGAAELYDPIALNTALDNARAETAQSADAKPLMPTSVSQSDLERFGVATDVAAELKQITTEDALQEIVEALPASQGNAVLDLAFGKDPQDVWNDLVIEEPGPIDTEDLETALKRPLSRLSFTAVDGDSEEELRAVLEGDFAKWRVWLHPLQRSLATHEGWNGPFRVTGGAGTGKTVTAIHRARFLAKRLDIDGADAKSKVLFTTFTRNLAQTIEGQLVQLAGPSITERVHVVNIDALARSIVAATDSGRVFVNSSKIAAYSEIDQLWRTAAQSCKGSWDPSFLNAEWSEVVLGNVVVDEAQYLRVARSGRSQRLTRPQRADVWLAIEQFQLLMRAQGLTTFTELAARAATALESDPALGEHFGYRHAVIDEAQDLHPAHWKLLRALIAAGTDDLFIVGDAHQRIYGKPAPLSRFGIETRGRARRLTVNYRTSREILRWCLQIADSDADDLDMSSDTLAGARSVFRGPEPESLGFDSKAEEDQGVAAKIDQWIADGCRRSDIAVFVYERNDVRESADLLSAAGIDAEIVNESTKEEKLGDVVRVMTMHRAKGLEFRAVAMARLGAKSFPPYYVQQKQGIEREQEEKKLLRVLYVAGSRARERLALFWTDELSPLLRK